MALSKSTGPGAAGSRDLTKGDFSDGGSFEAFFEAFSPFVLLLKVFEGFKGGFEA